MPNVACNTSSFLKSNCKYCPWVEASETTDDDDVRQEMSVDGSSWGNYGTARACLSKCWSTCWSLGQTIQPAPNVEFDSRTDAGSCRLTSARVDTGGSNKDALLTAWKNIKVWHDLVDSCCQTRTMERKSQLKTIKVRLLSVSSIFI